MITKVIAFLIAWVMGKTRGQGDKVAAMVLRGVGVRPLDVELVWVPRPDMPRRLSAPLPDMAMVKAVQGTPTARVGAQTSFMEVFMITKVIAFLIAWAIGKTRGQGDKVASAGVRDNAFVVGVGATSPAAQSVEQYAHDLAKAAVIKAKAARCAAYRRYKAAVKAMATLVQAQFVLDVRWMAMHHTSTAGVYWRARPVHGNNAIRMLAAKAEVIASKAALVDAAHALACAKASCEEAYMDSIKSVEPQLQAPDTLREKAISAKAELSVANAPTVFTGVNTKEDWTNHPLSLSAAYDPEAVVKAAISTFMTKYPAWRVMVQAQGTLSVLRNQVSHHLLNELVVTASDATSEKHRIRDLFIKTLVEEAAFDKAEETKRYKESNMTIDYDKGNDPYLVLWMRSPETGKMVRRSFLNNQEVFQKITSVELAQFKKDNVDIMGLLHTGELTIDEKMSIKALWRVPEGFWTLMEEIRDLKTNVDYRKVIKYANRMWCKGNGIFSSDAFLDIPEDKIILLKKDDPMWGTLHCDGTILVDRRLARKLRITAMQNGWFIRKRQFHKGRFVVADLKGTAYEGCIVSAQKKFETTKDVVGFGFVNDGGVSSDSRGNISAQICRIVGANIDRSNSAEDATKIKDAFHKLFRLLVKDQANKAYERWIDVNKMLANSIGLETILDSIKDIYDLENADPMTDGFDIEAYKTLDREQAIAGNRIFKAYLAKKVQSKLDDVKNQSYNIGGKSYHIIMLPPDAKLGLAGKEGVYIRNFSDKDKFTMGVRSPSAVLESMGCYDCIKPFIPELDKMFGYSPDVDNLIVFVGIDANTKIHQNGSDGDDTISIIRVPEDILATMAPEEIIIIKKDMYKPMSGDECLVNPEADEYASPVLMPASTFNDRFAAINIGIGQPAIGTCGMIMNHAMSMGNTDMIGKASIALQCALDGKQMSGDLLILINNLIDDMMGGKIIHVKHGEHTYMQRVYAITNGFFGAKDGKYDNQEELVCDATVLNPGNVTLDNLMRGFFPVKCGKKFGTLRVVDMDQFNRLASRNNLNNPLNVSYLKGLFFSHKMPESTGPHLKSWMRALTNYQSHGDRGMTFALKCQSIAAWEYLAVARRMVAEGHIGCFDTKASIAKSILPTWAVVADEDMNNLVKRAFEAIHYSPELSFGKNGKNYPTYAGFRAAKATILKSGAVKEDMDIEIKALVKSYMAMGKVLFDDILASQGDKLNRNSFIACWATLVNAMQNYSSRNGNTTALHFKTDGNFGPIFPIDENGKIWTIKDKAVISPSYYGIVHCSWMLDNLFIDTSDRQAPDSRAL